jgi:hypothetical protein
LALELLFYSFYYFISQAGLNSPLKILFSFIIGDERNKGLHCFESVWIYGSKAAPFMLFAAIFDYLKVINVRRQFASFLKAVCYLSATFYCGRDSEMKPSTNKKAQKKCFMGYRLPLQDFS